MQTYDYIPGWIGCLTPIAILISAWVAHRISTLSFRPYLSCRYAGWTPEETMMQVLSVHVKNFGNRTADNIEIALEKPDAGVINKEVEGILHVDKLVPEDCSTYYLRGATGQKQTIRLTYTFGRKKYSEFYTFSRLVRHINDIYVENNKPLRAIIKMFQPTMKRNCHHLNNRP